MRRALAFLCGLLACSAALAETREWTPSSGDRIEAEFVRCSLGVVTLSTAEGKTVRVQLAQLSKDDREYVQQKLKEKAAKPDKGDDASAPRRMRTSPGSPELVEQMKPGETLTRTAAGQTGITYRLYVPTSFKRDDPPPLIIAFSPTGDGAGMVNALKASAEKVGWLVAGCDKLRNSMDPGEDRGKMNEEVLADILRCVPHQIDRRCLAGMSGGAMSCYGLIVEGCRQEDYFGLLAFGGWLGGSGYRRKKYKPNVIVAQMNGDQDSAANSWLEGDAEALTKRGCVVRAFPFPGGHVIAPPPVIDEAIAWMVGERERLEDEARKRVRRR